MHDIIICAAYCTRQRSANYKCRFSFHATRIDTGNVQISYQTQEEDACMLLQKEDVRYSCTVVMHCSNKITDSVPACRI